MKKILCPVDFSEASDDGLQYAASLANELRASMTLLYVRTSIWPEAIQLQEETLQSNQEIGAKLSFLSNQVQKEVEVPCDFLIEQTTLTFEETVASIAHDYDLIVMGTNGCDTFYQYAFGSNAFHVVEKSNCQVLIIPMGVVYQPVRLMIYAYDPETNPIFLVENLKKMAISLGTVVNVLHVMDEKPSVESSHRMEILNGAIKARATKNISWNFNFQYSDDIPWTLNKYMKNNKCDMLALSFHHRSLIEKLFTKNVIKQISMIAEYPVFIFWR